MDSHDATTMRARERERAANTTANELVLTIAWHPNSERVGDRAVLSRAAKISRLEPEFGRGGAERSPIGDPNVSRQPIKLASTSNGDVDLLGYQECRINVDGVPLSNSRHLSAAAINRGVVLELADRVVVILRRTRVEQEKSEAEGLLGVSAEIAWVADQIKRVAASEVNVLVRGPTGVGKELVARAIHRQSDRPAGPFVAVNVATLPVATAASQLFGHVKGAFTGADTDYLGLFGAADGGSLFLDEIGEASAEVQAMLLRSLESGEVTPVGAVHPRALSVRVLAATDGDLEGAARDGKFRAPLLHRLAGYQIEVPSLASRRDDVGPLLVSFLAQELASVGSNALERREPTEPLWLSAAQVSRLVRHRWPGNVRQLRNLTRRLAIACGDAYEVSDAELLRALETGLRGDERASDERASDERGSDKRTGDWPLRRRPDSVDDDELVSMLRSHQWKTSSAARALGISRTSLYALIEKCPRVRKARDIEANEIERVLKTSKSTVDAAATLEVSERGLKLRMKELGLVGV